MNMPSNAAVPNRLSYSDQGIHCIHRDAGEFFIEWACIQRVGILTQESIVACEDSYVVVESPAAIYLFSDILQGVHEVEAELRRRFPPIYGPRGTLASELGNASVVTWPPAEATQELTKIWDRFDAEHRKPLVWLHRE